MSQESKIISEIRKNRKILQEIISVHNTDHSDCLTKDPRSYNVPFLLEQTMAMVGGYEFVDAAHFDFSDGTECKSASVQANAQIKNGNETSIHSVRITNTISGAGIEKSGDLRVVLYNNVTDSLEYFFIPQRDIFQLSTIDISNKVGNIHASYNSKTGLIPKLEKYRMPDFVSLCKHKSTYLNVEVTLEVWMNSNINEENVNVCVN